MATIDRTLTTFALPTITDTEVERHPGTTSIDRALNTFPFGLVPIYDFWQLSWPIIFCTMGDDTAIEFKQRTDNLPVVFYSAGVRRYKYINVFYEVFDMPSAPIDTEVIV